MPAKVGQFISKHVYGAKLQSAESVVQAQDCIRIIDVVNGGESQSGTSIMVSSYMLCSICAYV